jgi:hypothetical protein
VAGHSIGSPQQPGFYVYAVTSRRKQSLWPHRTASGTVYAAMAAMASISRLRSEVCYYRLSFTHIQGLRDSSHYIFRRAKMWQECLYPAGASTLHPVPLVEHLARGRLMRSYQNRPSFLRFWLCPRRRVERRQIVAIVPSLSWF